MGYRRIDKQKTQSDNGNGEQQKHSGLIKRSPRAFAVPYGNTAKNAHRQRDRQAQPGAQNRLGVQNAKQQHQDKQDQGFGPLGRRQGILIYLGGLAGDVRRTRRLRRGAFLRAGRGRRALRGLGRGILRIPSLRRRGRGRRTGRGCRARLQCGGGPARPGIGVGRRPSAERMRRAAGLGKRRLSLLIGRRLVLRPPSRNRRFLLCPCRAWSTGRVGGIPRREYRGLIRPVRFRRRTVFREIRSPSIVFLHLVPSHQLAGKMVSGRSCNKGPA